MSVRHSPVPEPLPSQVPESIIDCNEAIHLMLPGHKWGSASDPINTSDSSSDASLQGQLYGENPANLAYLVNPLSKLATPPPNLARLLGTPLANPANLLENPDNPLANIPANQANDLTQALTMLTSSIQAPCPAVPQCTKIHEPDPLDGFWP